jgi:hypothetical protein
MERKSQILCYIFGIVILVLFLISLQSMLYFSSLNNSKQYVKNVLTSGIEDVFTPKEYKSSAQYQRSLVEKGKTANDDVYKSISGYKLRDFYIASSSKTCMCRKLYNDYISTDMIDFVLKNGSRMIELDIFNNSYCDNGEPVVANSDDTYLDYKNEIATYNYIKFDRICERISTKAFSGTNKSDPLFLKLNLHLNKHPEEVRINLCGKIADIVYKRFANYILDENYSYQKQQLGNIPIEKTFNKIIILCSDGFQDSNLDELVNYSWEAGSTSEPKSKAPLNFNLYESDFIKNLGPADASELELASTSGGMSCVIPTFNGTESNKYDTQQSFNVGCNLIAVRYNLGSQLDETYKKMFKNYSLVLKPLELRKQTQTITYDSYQNPDYDMKERKIEVNDPSFASDLGV